MGAKKCVIKKELKFEDYKNCLDTNWLENEINNLEKNKIVADCLKKDYKEFIQNNKLILKTPQWFRSEIHNVFTEEVKKITLSPNDDKRIRWIDFIKPYTYGTSNWINY